MHRGYVKTYKKKLEWQWYTDVPVCRLFDHLILKANFKPKKWLNITIDRGQLATSLETLALETGLTVRQVRTALTKLKSTGEVTIKTGNKYTIVTISSYDIYQDSDTQNDKQTTNKRQTDDKRTTTTIEGKEDKKDKEVKEKKDKHPTLFSDLPTWIPKPDWDDFVEMRKRKTPLTEGAGKLIINRLLELKNSGHDPAKVLQQSTMSGWTGVFPLKADFNGMVKPKQKPHNPITANESPKQNEENWRIPGVNYSKT